MHNTSLFEKVAKEKRNLNIASIFAVVVSITNATLYIFDYLVSSYLRLLVIATYTALWGSALHRLFLKLKNKEQLIPKAKMFRLHFVILIC